MYERACKCYVCTRTGKRRKLELRVNNRLNIVGGTEVKILHTSRSWTLTLVMAFIQWSLDWEKGNGGPSSSWKLGLGYMDWSIRWKEEKEEISQFSGIFIISHTFELQAKMYLWSLGDPVSAVVSLFMSCLLSGDSLSISRSLTTECPLMERFVPFVRSCPLVEGWKPVLW